MKDMRREFDHAMMSDAITAAEQKSNDQQNNLPAVASVTVTSYDKVTSTTYMLNSARWRLARIFGLPDAFLAGFAFQVEAQASWLSGGFKSNGVRALGSRHAPSASLISNSINEILKLKLINLN